MMPSTRDDAARETDRLTVLTFSLAGDRYCVRSDAVASVLGISDPSSLAAAADPWNAGSVAVRGERIRVVDLGRILASRSDLGTRLEDPMVLVLTDGDGDASRGWLVDDVDVTRTVRTAALEPTRVPTQYVDGRFAFDDGSAILLDESAIRG